MKELCNFLRSLERAVRSPLLEFCQTACELGINAAPLHWRVLIAVNNYDRFGLKDDGTLLGGCFEQIANLDADLLADALWNNHLIFIFDADNGDCGFKLHSSTGEPTDSV